MRSVLEHIYNNRLDTAQACLGIEFFRKDIVFYYSAESICVLNVNRYQVPFAFFKSTPLMVERCQDKHDTTRARIVVSCSDGSIRLVSPVSGAFLVTMFPIHRDTYPKNIVYDFDYDMLYSFCSNGEIVVYDTSTSPGRVVSVWESQNTSYQLTAICSATTSQRKSTRYQQRARRITSLFAGTSDGQLVYINTASQGKLESLVQV